MTREERRQARIERYRKLAANATAQSEELFRKSSRMADAIPFGQPILVGHYSEKSDRNYRNRIRNTKRRLEQAVKLKNTESEEYMIADVKVVTNTEDNRLQLFFPDKPDEEMRKKLKQNGFRWSPSNGCWQSYLTRIQVDRARRIING